jgi:hypothetical protein
MAAIKCAALSTALVRSFRDATAFFPPRLRGRVVEGLLQRVCAVELAHSHPPPLAGEGKTETSFT